MVCDGAKRQAVPDTPKSCKTQAADSGGQRRTRKRLQNAGGGQWRTAARRKAVKHRWRTPWWTVAASGGHAKYRKAQVADTVADSGGHAKGCKTQEADSGGQQRTRKNAVKRKWRTPWWTVAASGGHAKCRKTQVADTVVDSGGKRRTCKMP